MLKLSIGDKFALLILILMVELVVFITIAYVFDFETENSLFGAIAIYTIVGTLIGFLVKIIKDHKRELSLMKMPVMGYSVLFNLYFLISIILIVMVRISIDILTEVLLYFFGYEN